MAAESAATASGTGTAAGAGDAAEATATGASRDAAALDPTGVVVAVDSAATASGSGAAAGAGAAAEATATGASRDAAALDPTGVVVAVTGASGFVASHTIAFLLQRGYTVRGTVRSLSDMTKYDFLRRMPGAAERLTLLEANLVEPNSFDTAIKGCTYVLHIASPFVLNVEDPQRDLVDPAVNGTRNVLESVKKAGTVKRVVVTASMASVTDEPCTGYTFTEDDWNEREAYRFVDEEQKDLPADKRFTLCTICPLLITGPMFAASQKNASPDGTVGEMLRGNIPANMAIWWGFVHVHDVARAHIAAMEVPSASGRYICADPANILAMEDVAKLLIKMGYQERGYKIPTTSITGGCPSWLIRTTAGLQYSKGVVDYLSTHLGPQHQFDYDCSKIKRELGIEFTPVERILADYIPSAIEHGHIPNLPLEK